MWHFINYLMLQNKLHQNLVSLKNKHLSSHSFCGSGIKEQLSQVLVQGLSWTFTFQIFLNEHVLVESEKMKVISSFCIIADG